MHNDLTVQLKLMRLISRPLSIQIVIPQHMFAEELNVSHRCIQKKLKQLGYVKKLDLWVPHQLKEIHSMQLISICDSLLKRNEIDPFLKRLITGHEKNQTINLNVYVQQLAKLNETVQEKRPELENRKDVVLQHDNAKPHTSLVIRQKLLELGWDVMPHSSYSPELAIYFVPCRTR
uniref:Transposase n=1 Tax=Vespula pensylvanica TaxID=30213 RepID=A0A834JQ57_VESPE|nr:hypothetical protein H0235_017483 [Vespula pensylvanica]